MHLGEVFCQERAKIKPAEDFSHSNASKTLTYGDVKLAKMVAFNGRGNNSRHLNPSNPPPHQL